VAYPLPDPLEAFHGRSRGSGARFCDDDGNDGGPEVGRGRENPMRLTLVAVVLAAVCLVGGCGETFVELSGESDPCDPDGVSCVWHEDGFGVERCCSDGPNCMAWTEAGRFVCAAGAPAEVAINDGAVVECRAAGAVCHPPTR
jgi:hypothetical protein